MTDRIKIPARRRDYTDQRAVIRISPEAYNTLVDLYNESSLSMCQLASLLITEAAKNVEFEKG